MTTNLLKWTLFDLDVIAFFIKLSKYRFCRYQDFVSSVVLSLFFMLQNMEDLQTVAFMSFAYDSVPDRDDGKEKLKEVEIQKEAGNWEQDLVKAALRLKETDHAETKDTVQDGLQQRNDRPARKHQDLSLIRFRLFLGNEITARRDRAETIF